MRMPCKTCGVKLRDSEPGLNCAPCQKDGQARLKRENTPKEPGKCPRCGGLMPSYCDECYGGEKAQAHYVKGEKGVGPVDITPIVSAPSDVPEPSLRPCGHDTRYIRRAREGTFCECVLCRALAAEKELSTLRDLLERYEKWRDAVMGLLGMGNELVELLKKEKQEEINGELRERVADLDRRMKLVERRGQG